MRIFGPKPEAAIDRALTRTLVGKPSILARALVGDVNKKMDCDNCMAVILSLWKRSLPSYVRAGIAHMSFTKENFNAVTQLADDIFESQPNPAVSAVRADGAIAAAAAASSSSLNATQPALQYPVPEVNAVRFNRGGRGGRWNRGNRGGRGRGGGGGNGNQNGQGGGGGNQAQSGQSNQSGSQRRGTRHPDIPPGEWSGCNNHYRYGKSAFFCSEPATCPWKNIYAVRPNNK